MFFIWGFSSWFFIFFSLFCYFFLRKRFFLCWVFLEILTWSIFFFFSLNWSKKSQKNMYTFFLIQRISSIIWLIRIYIIEELGDLEIRNRVKFLDNLGLRTIKYLLEIIVILILFIKMGLFSGHIWRWHVYRSKIIWIVFFLSTFQKIFPLIILRFFINFFKVSFFFKIIILLSVFLVFKKSWIGSDLFFLIFISGLINYSMVLLMQRIYEFSFSRIYLISYWRIFLFFLYLIKEKHKKRFLVNLNRISHKMDYDFLILIILIRGFPPSSIFFLKIYFITTIKNSLIRLFTFFLITALFIYLSFVIFSFFRNYYSLQTRRKGKFILMEKLKNENGEASQFIVFLTFLTFLILIILN